ncbi:Cell wall-active antibiotics response 4TMS YvqF [Filimonas lacunae]|uniref:Cell wall-active antibiotics response 4TMS YvqF n=1 Tax=Filimonas lacunae TaxID=477680 RepID=A0A173MKC6_9BACT|nr:DUF5668 domain-containing protein [Filimonas lacunae]BAV08054.1 hypothetical protein FLA_4087 [Filimonas lacunae]SIT08642.1 Cell wall-active antibiotics response 4TMS YvqF [Filimonas lacunae]
MDNFEDKPEIKRSGVLGGLFLVIIGSVLLAHKMGAPFPDWLFTWPMILIVAGIFSGIKKRFRDFSWLILIALGGIFLTERMFPELNFKEYILPVVVIFIGICFLFRPRHFKDHSRCGPRHFRHRMRQHPFMNTGEPVYGEKKNESGGVAGNAGAAGTTDYSGMADTFATAGNSGAQANEILDSVSVFGAVRKKVVSKKFAGGEVTCFMGGSEIDLSQADIQGEVILDITQVFGGTKLIVPPHWDLKADVAAVFGGVEDKRVLHGTAVDLSKVLILKGTSVFGGIDIVSY